jgi:hypothetical protein
MTKPTEETVRSLVERGYMHRGGLRFLRPDGRLCRLEPRAVFEGHVTSWYVKHDWDCVVLVSQSVAGTPPEITPNAAALAAA